MIKQYLISTLDRIAALYLNKKEGLQVVEVAIGRTKENNL